MEFLVSSSIIEIRFQNRCLSFTATVSYNGSGWLKYHSPVFNYIEIDSSFYRIPTVFMVKNWAKKTPANHTVISGMFPRFQMLLLNIALAM